MAQNTRYFRLREHVGVEGPVLVDSIDAATGTPNEIENPKAGELQPLKCQGLTVGVPKFDGQNRIGLEVRSVEITTDGTYTVVPDGSGRAKRVGLANTDDKVIDAENRILALNSPALISGINDFGIYEEIDAPKATQTRKPKPETEA